MSSSSSESDSEEVKLTSAPNVITVPYDENLIDVSTQTTKPVTRVCGDVLQKLDIVLDNLRDLRDDLAMQSCDILRSARDVFPLKSKWRM